MRGTILSLAALVAFAPFATLEAASLRGSPASMQQQNAVAQDHGLDFYRTAEQIYRAVERGELVELAGNADYEVADFVTFPFVRPELDLFVERLAAQYHAACGERLVVTSATRPTDEQPVNAHALSVHPAGMALDLRVSRSAECRGWLEAALLGMEARGVLNGTREFHPPHFHVAVFPQAYAAYAAERIAAEEAAERAASPAPGRRGLIASLHAAPAPDREAGGIGLVDLLRLTRPAGLVTLTLRAVTRAAGLA